MEVALEDVEVVVPELTVPDIVVETDEAVPNVERLDTDEVPVTEVLETDVEDFNPVALLVDDIEE